MFGDSGQYIHYNKRQLVSDIGYAYYASNTEKKAQRLWDWAVLKVLEGKDLENTQQLAPLVRGIAGRVGLFKKEAKIREKYYAEVLDPKHRGVAYAEKARDKSHYGTEIQSNKKGEQILINYLGRPLTGDNFIFVLDHAGRCSSRG